MAPPTVRQAVEVLHVLDHIEESEDLYLLADLVSSLDWSPALIDRNMIIRAFERNPIKLTIIFYKAITQGFDPKKISEQAGTAKKGKTDFSSLIEHYREVYGGSRWEVWNEIPFSFLLETMNNIRHERALKSIHQSSIHNPSTKTINGWNADINDEKYQDKESMMFDDLSDEEIEKEKELARTHYMRK